MLVVGFFGECGVESCLSVFDWLTFRYVVQLFVCGLPKNISWVFKSCYNSSECCCLRWFYMLVSVLRARGEQNSPVVDQRSTQHLCRATSRILWIVPVVCKSIVEGIWLGL